MTSESTRSMGNGVKLNQKNLMEKGCQSDNGSNNGNHPGQLRNTSEKTKRPGNRITKVTTEATLADQKNSAKTTKYDGQQKVERLQPSKERQMTESQK